MWLVSWSISKSNKDGQVQEAVICFISNYDIMIKSSGWELITKEHIAMHAIPYILLPLVLYLVNIFKEVKGLL